MFAIDVYTSFSAEKGIVIGTDTMHIRHVPLTQEALVECLTFVSYVKTIEENVSQAKHLLAGYMVFGDEHYKMFISGIGEEDNELWCGFEVMYQKMFEEDNLMMKFEQRVKETSASGYLH